MQSGAFLSHGDAAGNLKVFSNRTFMLFYKVVEDYESAEESVSIWLVFSETT